jgi:hypothetical protein
LSIDRNSMVANVRQVTDEAECLLREAQSHC